MTENELRAQIATGTLELKDLTVEMIKTIKSKNLIEMVTATLCNDPWPFMFFNKLLIKAIITHPKLKRKYQLQVFDRFQITFQETFDEILG